MYEPSNGENPLRQKFHQSSTTDVTNKNPSTDAAMSSMQYYAIGSEQERHFDLILRSGEEYTIPYSLLPVYVLSGGTIKIMAYELLITIKGRNLNQIRNVLKKETLIWLKESPSQQDDGQANVFISDIIVQGKTVGKGKIN